ncbi:MAG: hypothetical protein ACI9FN_004093 [Saprospiraceae bacterium]|jgi:hypothetical protein
MGILKYLWDKEWTVHLSSSGMVVMNGVGYMYMDWVLRLEGVWIGGSAKISLDNETTKNEVLGYLMEIEYFDSHLGKRFQYLEKFDELENTLIIFTADNGMPFPYAKANSQEYGTHVPLAILWYRGIKKY